MKTNTKKIELSRLVPPGVDPKNEIIGFVLLLFLVFLLSTPFFARFHQAEHNLYYHYYEELVLKEGAVMEDINFLLRRTFLGAWLIPALSIADAVTYRLSFRKKSMSIYVMKRLPRSWELWRRCLTFPLLKLIVGIAFCALLLWIYYCTYRSVPAQCLPETVTIDLWRILL